ncbi:MAG TPA: DUF6152 family protein, partial [Gammaproteobacteria bacterium]|nr:DUF6152 family protein [Gammaproteobacteria bacterium]
EAGNSETWQAEMGGPQQLARNFGWDRNTLSAGDRIRLTGRVVKSGAPYINLSERSRLLRADSCEVLYESGMIFGERPDYPPPSCD